MTTTTALREALKHYTPSAIVLDQSEVIAWSMGVPSRMENVLRAISIGEGVWYRLPDHDVSGYRFGTDGPDYVSGFAYL